MGVGEKLAREKGEMGRKIYKARTMVVYVAKV